MRARPDRVGPPGGLQVPERGGEGKVSALTPHLAAAPMEKYVNTELWTLLRSFGDPLSPQPSEFGLLNVAGTGATFCPRQICAFLKLSDSTQANRHVTDDHC